MACKMPTLCFCASYSTVCTFYVSSVAQHAFLYACQERHKALVSSAVAAAGALQRQAAQLSRISYLRFKCLYMHIRDCSRNSKRLFGGNFSMGLAHGDCPILRMYYNLPRWLSFSLNVRHATFSLAVLVALAYLSARFPVLAFRVFLPPRFFQGRTFPEEQTTGKENRRNQLYIESFTEKKTRTTSSVSKRS